MNAHTQNQNAFSRRAMLQSTGALVISFSIAPITEAVAEIAPAVPTGRPPLAPTQLDSWIAIAKDGSVTVYFGKIDGGQGTDLAMGMIVAEEMDVPMSKVHVIQGDTALTVNQGGASGSTGVRFAGTALRQAGAEARRVLVMRAAEKLGVPAEQLTVMDGVVSAKGDPSKNVSYADIINGGYFNSEIGWNKQYGNPLALTSPAKPKSYTEYKIVGTSPARFDVKGKVFGTDPWVSDVRIPGMLHGRMIRPMIPGAKIASVDESSIADIPGARVMRKAEFIGVVAPREWDAIKAAQALKITWSSVKDPFIDMDEIYTHIRNAPVVKGDEEVRGNMGDGFAKAAKVVTAEYEWPFQSHASMGPGCAVADVKADGTTTVWTGTQKPHSAAQGIAGCLGVTLDKVRCIWVTGPGSYGRNDAGDVACDAAVMSQLAGAPVRVQYMRYEGIAWDPKGPASTHRGRAALDAGGNVIAFDFTSKGFSRLETNSAENDPGDTLAGMLLGHKGPHVQAFNTPENGYTFANRRHAWETIAPMLEGPSPLRTSHLRDPLGPQITFASETFMDEIAFAAGADPVEFRIRHLKAPRDIAAIKAAAEKLDWKTGPAGARRERKNGFVHGKGLAYAQRNGTIVAVGVEVAVNLSTGELRVPHVVVAHDCGLVINPDALKRVVEGNVCQGLSRTIHEQVRFEKKGVTSVDWITYPILDIMEAPPKVDVVLLNHPEAIATGAGEATMRPLAAAVNNAIFEATGVRIRRAPLNTQNIKAAGV